MFDIRILKKAGEDKNLEHSEFRVFFIVLNTMAVEKVTKREWNYSELTSTLKMSESTVKRALKKLEENGYLKRRKLRYGVIIMLKRDDVIWKNSKVTSDPTDNKKVTSEVTSEVTSDPTFIKYSKYNKNNKQLDCFLHLQENSIPSGPGKSDEVLPWENVEQSETFTTF